ncbi:peptidylprolyl isomerase [Mastigocoleus testarum]|uniref:peptidylprolyl isomerase n=1 Tax=Mastigocoleus testarum BC008 TaxID=371196 RepID=A0A0V7ZC23_9CYAN|nr:peptidylprolyl isomerase [Mastigocoleus testarum]KST62056.1 peptidylprolyl isomerase [Mastigocoleus testarum BC008]KST62762.1 peptidylprolyl isomerase [Mastigocoleus testarum BC008]
MPQSITITNEDILRCVKLYCEIPTLNKKIITRKVIENTANEVGVKVDTEELQQAADKFRFMNKLNSAEDTWTWLKKHNLSLEDFEEFIRIDLLSNKLLQHLFLDKIEPYFFEYQLDYVGVVMYEVVLEDEELAIELFYAIKEGEMSFYDIAHQYIQDTELRRKCGYRGIVHRKDMKPEISAAVFAAKSPQFLKPVVTSDGVHLILIEEIIQPQLDETLRQKISSDLFSEWINEESAKFEIINDLEDHCLTNNTETYLLSK